MALDPLVRWRIELHRAMFCGGSIGSEARIDRLEARLARIEQAIIRVKERLTVILLTTTVERNRPVMAEVTGTP